MITYLGSTGVGLSGNLLYNPLTNIVDIAPSLSCSVGLLPTTSSVFNFYAWNPGAENNTADITASLQNFLLWCQLQAYKLKGSALDDQAQRIFVTAYLPRGFYYVSSPIIVPENVNIKGDGLIIRNGSAGTITSFYTGNTASEALANLYMPTVIIVPRAHAETANIYSNNDGVHLGSGMFVGKNWSILSVAVGATGSGYLVNDVLTLAQPSLSPYIPATATVSSINGSGGIIGISITAVGAYALPPVLQAQQWTAANGFSVFDGSGNFLTTGGHGTGATLAATWSPDWSNGNDNYYMGYGGLITDTVLGHIRLMHIPTTTDATYGPAIALRVYGLNYTIEDVEAQGGKNCFDFTNGADVRANILNSVDSSNPIVCTSSSSIVCKNCVLDTPSGSVIIDNSTGIVLSGRIFNRAVQNFPGTPPATFELGQFSSGSQFNLSIDLDFICTLAGAGNSNPSLAGCAALAIAYTGGSSKINLNITNSTVGYSGNPPIINSFATFGTSVDSTVELTGSIDLTTGALFSGTNPGCAIRIWDSFVGGWAQNNGTYDFISSGAPTSGSSGTGVLKAGPGSYYTDYTNTNTYINTNTAASPTWTLQGSLPPSVFASFPAASAHANQTILATDIGSGGTLFISNGTIWRPVNGRCVLAASAVNQSVTGTTAETTLASYTVPAGLMTANGVITITSLWNWTNNSDNKTLKIYFGGTSSGTQFMNPVVTTSATFQNQTIIRNRGLTNSQVGFAAGTTTPFATTSGTPLTSALDTTQAQAIVFTGLLATSSDTINLEAYSIELMIP